MWQKISMKKDTPGEMRKFITLNYNKGFVTEAGKLSNGSYIANLLDGNVVKQVYFDRTMAWNYTEWPVLPGQISGSSEGCTERRGL